MEDKRDLLISYLEANVSPILTDITIEKNSNNTIILSSDISISELNGYYNGMDFLPPVWLNKILNSNGISTIIIDNIDKISKQEQEKFIELLKYRKISTFELPTDTRIIVTANVINEDTINKNIYSLVTHIGD